MKRFECVEDLQRTDFGVGFVGTIEDWREKALYWSYCDGNEGAHKLLKKLPEKEVIDFIQDYWDLVIEVVE